MDSEAFISDSFFFPVYFLPHTFLLFNVSVIFISCTAMLGLQVIIGGSGGGGFIGGGAAAAASAGSAPAPAEEKKEEKEESDEDMGFSLFD